MISGVRFASCYVYSPAGADPNSERSRRLCVLLKTADVRFLQRYAVRVRQEMADVSPLRDFIAPGDALVPVPGSQPRTDTTTCVAWHLCDALRGEGLGHAIWPVLRRTHAVRKSATAVRGARPTVGCHYDSFAIDATVWDAEMPTHVVLVDDIVTKGRTLLAAAARMHEAFPAARIRAFALIRTMGRVAGVNRFLDPCVGEIRWRSGDARRSP
jgi:predicted amidophosphoribosyltransferase